MTKTLEVNTSNLIEQHCNRNPRVQAFRELPGVPGVIEIDYDPAVAVPIPLAAEAHDLGLQQLADYPR